MNHRTIGILALSLLTSCTDSPSSTTKTRAQEFASQSSIAFNAMDYAKAQSLAAQATKINPEFAEAWIGYGMASVRLQQNDVARKAYERALSLYQARQRADPDDANNELQQIFTLSLLRRTNEAAALLKQAKTDYPNDPQISRLAENYPKSMQWFVDSSVETK